MEEYVTIHGDKWKTADIKESVEWARAQEWKKQKWVPRAALVSEGRITEYVGQRYNSEHTELIEDGWNHDHCEICWWSLNDSEDPEHGEGFTIEGRRWVCTECYNQFIAAKA